jgi:hypothetical protein
VDNLLMSVETMHLQKNVRKRAGDSIHGRTSRPISERLLDHDSGSDYNDDDVDFSELENMELQQATEFMGVAAPTSRVPTTDKRID